MLRLAARMLALDLPRSWIVGDRASDLQAGRNAGLAGGMLVAAGCGSGGGESPAAAPLRPDGGFQVRSAATVAEALDLPPLTARP
jgi:D-glycero-D-manno-heptose 1,7-bisphosphate phosphatase